jgi:hypothetical protein
MAETLWPGSTSGTGAVNDLMPQFPPEAGADFIRWAPEIIMKTAPKTASWYFDFISGFAYLQFATLGRLPGSLIATGLFEGDSFSGLDQLPVGQSR